MGLREAIRNEPVSALALRKAVLVEATMSTRDVVARMKEARIGCAFVVDENNHPIGKFTERLLVRMLHNNPAMLDEPVDNLDIPLEGCVCLSDPISRVIHDMQETGLRFVCVTDADGCVVGLTGQRGVIEYIAEHFPRQVKAQLLEAKLHLDQREGA